MSMPAALLPLERLDDLERRVGRVERHLGWAVEPGRAGVVTAAVVASPPVRPEANGPPDARAAAAAAVEAEWDAVIPPGGASAAHDWMSAARDEAAVRRARMKELLPRDAATGGTRAPMAPPPLPPPLAPVSSTAVPAVSPEKEHGRDAHAARGDEGADGATGRSAERASAAAGVLTYEQPRGAAASADVAKRGVVPQSNFEQMIGLKLAGWVGAIVLVIGAGLGIKYAYDQGFFGGVPPIAWLSLLYFGGFALIGAGEYVFRRINPLSAAGVFGAGVATLFLVSYAGHGYYALYQQQTAFALMALSTLIGAGVAMRGRLVSIASLSLIGGLLAPLVLSNTDVVSLTPMLAYLLMLQVVALVLSWWGGSARWWTLRGLSLGGTAVWMAGLLLGAAAWSAPMAFMLVYAALYQLEVALSAMRKRDDTRRAVAAGAGVGFSLIVTTLLTIATLWIFRDAAGHVRGLWVVSYAALAGAASLVAGRKGAAALAYGYRAQATVLLLLAVPVTFGRASISLGWAALGLGLAAIGAKLDDKVARYTAVVAWVLAGLNLGLWATDFASQAAAHARWVTIFNQPIEAWTAIGWALAVVGHAIAWLIAPREQKGAPILSAIASGAFAVVTVMSLPLLGATGVLLAYAWLLFGADGFMPRLKLLAQAAVIIAAAAIKWAAVDAIAARTSSDWASGYVPLVNPLMLTAVAVAGSIVAMYRLRREQIEKHLSGAGLGVLTIVTVLIAIGLSLEVDRVVTTAVQSAWPIGQLRQMAWTTLWTACAAVYLGMLVKLRPGARGAETLHAFAWLVGGGLALKFVFVDTILFGLAAGGARVVGPLPVFNVQMIAATAVAGGLAFVHLLLRGGGGGGGRGGAVGAAGDATVKRESSALRVGLAALAVVLWAGTLEVDRLVASGVFPGAASWPTWQLKNFAWTALWSAGAVGFITVASWRDASAVRRLPILRALARVVVLLAIKYMVVDTMLFRLVRGPAGVNVVANLQTLCGAVVFGGLVLVRHWLADAPAGGRAGVCGADVAAASLRRAAGAIAMVMLLWLGSLEIDRAFARSAVVMSAFADPRIAKQVALSIFWSGFAIAAVAGGFRLRIAGLRYFGLALFALTLAKVGLIDLRNAQTGYRILSFIGLGGLLLGTSILYGKVSPRLLTERAEASA